MPAVRRGEVATRTNPSVARRTPLSRERVLRVAFERTDTDLDDWLTDAAASGLIHSWLSPAAFDLTERQ